MQYSEPPTRLYGVDAPIERRQRAVRNGEIPIAVYGLGKMGLPLAAVLAESTQNVVGVDIDETVVDTVTEGRSHIEGEPGLEKVLSQTVAEGKLDATTDGEWAAQHARVHVIIVPTVLDSSNKPDLTTIESVATDISSGLQEGDLVIVESTVPPKTTSGYLKPTLAAESGIECDSFGIAFCPERTASGRALKDIRGAYPKVVGGDNEESTRAAVSLYREVTENRVVTVTDCTTAECVKLFEGVYRDVNIALGNELAKLAHDLSVDVREAIDVANEPGYCDIHSPGPGVGGHCIPFYPYFLVDSSDTELPLIRTARGVNESMPEYTVDLLEQFLETSGKSIATSNIAILGITYRAGVDEIRAAPAFPIAELLSDRGATVFAADPICSDMTSIEAKPVTIDVLPALELDAVTIVTAHQAFETIGWDEMEDVIVLDGRNAFDDEQITLPVFTLGDGRRGPVSSSMASTPNPVDEYAARTDITDQQPSRVQSECDTRAKNDKTQR